MNILAILTGKNNYKNLYKNFKCSTEPDQQAAFTTPFFLHKIIPDFRCLGDNSDRAKFLNHQQNFLRKHDEREAAKNRKTAGPTTDANMSLAIAMSSGFLMWIVVILGWMMAISFSSSFFLTNFLLQFGFSSDSCC